MPNIDDACCAKVLLSTIPHVHPHFHPADSQKWDPVTNAQEEDLSVDLQLWPLANTAPEAVFSEAEALVFLEAQLLVVERQPWVEVQQKKEVIPDTQEVEAD